MRVALDDRVDTPFGRRAVDAELKGYPVRIEVGPRDLAAGNVVAGAPARRRQDAGRRSARRCGAVTAALEADQQALYDEALARREARHRRRDDAGRRDRGGGDRLGPAAVGGGRAWRARPRRTSAAVTVRCLVRADGSVPDSEDEPDLMANLARAY